MRDIEKDAQELKNLTDDLQDAIVHHDEGRTLDIIGQCRLVLDNISNNV